MFQYQFACFKLREIKHIVDDGQKIICRTFNGLQVVTLGRVKRCFQHLSSKADDAIERRTQLMRHIGQKLGFNSRSFLSTFFS